MPLFGSMPFQGRKWAPGVRLSGKESPAEEWMVDPALAIYGQDPRFPTSDQIVIPRGRAIGVRGDNYTYEGRAVVSIADGVDPYNLPTGYQGGVKPLGYSQANIFRQWLEHIQHMPTLERGAYVEVPYIRTVNDAYGTLQSGDRLTPYFGTVTSTYGDQFQRGTFVKWQPNTLYTVHAAASSIILLPAAAYPGFVPRVIWGQNAGTIVTGAVTYSFVSGTGWYATFGSAVTDVFYTYGQQVDQIVGEVGKIEPLSATHQFDGWLQWVTDDFRMWEYPPMLLRVPSTAVTNENPAYISAGVYQLANTPIAPHLSITVTLAPTGSTTFTVTDVNGVQTTVSSGSPLTLSTPTNFPFVDFTLGNQYQVNPVTGQLFISTMISWSGSMPAANTPFNQIKVSYSYETSYRDGRLYNAGIMGLTDGLGGSNYPGTPANLDVIGSNGALRAIIY